MPKVRGTTKRNKVCDPTIPQRRSTRNNHIKDAANQLEATNQSVYTNNSGNEPTCSDNNNVQIQIEESNYSDSDLDDGSNLNDSYDDSYDDDDRRYSDYENDISLDNSCDESIVDRSMNDSNNDLDDTDNTTKQTFSKQDMVASHLANFFSSETTQSQMALFMQLIYIINKIKLPTTINGLCNTLFDNKKKFICQKIMFCGHCLETVTPDQVEVKQTFASDRVKQTDSACIKCKTRLDTYYYTDIQDRIKNILNRFTYEDLKHTNSRENLVDIRDGRLYKNLLASENGKDFENQQAFSFSINTDEFSPKHSQNLKIWPVYLVINELPIESRFCFENIILAGVSIAEQKLNTDKFFKPIIMELANLELGLNTTIENIEKKRKFFLLAGVFDNPTKASILNMNQCNIGAGCTKFEQSGHLLNNSTDDQDIYIYKFNNNDYNGPLRIDQKYDQDLQTAISSDTIVNGTKGRCCLSSLTYFNPISSTCIDVMHSILESVIKTLFKHWFKSDSSEEYSLKDRMKEIDYRLDRVLPPKFVPSFQSVSIKSNDSWKTREYLAFILYYSLPVFQNIMHQKYYDNLKKLIIFIQIILSPSISVEILQKAELIVIDFVKEVSLLYPSSIQTISLHELLHLVDCTIEFVPLNRTSCYQFKSINRKLMRFTHRSDRQTKIGKQLIKMFFAAKNLSSFTRNISNNKASNYVQKRIALLSSNKKRIDFKTKFDKIEQTNDSNYIQTFESYIKKPISQLDICQRIIHNGIKYTSSDLNNRRCDSGFITDTNEHGLIQCFVIDNDNIYVIAKRVVISTNAYISDVCPEIESKSFLCSVSDQLFVEKIENLSKTVFTQISDKNCFESLFDSSHLFRSK